MESLDLSTQSADTITWDVIPPGEGKPLFDNALEACTFTLYANMKQVLAEGDKGGKQPTIGTRTDGAHLFYPGTTNALVGASEAGKTLLSLCVLADVIYSGGSVLIIDLDHNGANATAQRLRSFGVSEAQLTDVGRFRFASPESPTELEQIVAEAQLWRPDAALVDSVGETMALFGKNSNDPDQYRQVHLAVFAALAKSGASVILIDHEPKSEGTASFGASGTAAKKQAIDGAYYRQTIKKPFVKGQGGKAVLSVLKDRHGAIREISGQGKEPVAATFHLRVDQGAATTWKFYPPEDGETLAASKAEADLAEVLKLDPPPTSGRDIKARCKWGDSRAYAAWKLYCDRKPEPGAVPVPHLKSEGTRETPHPVPEGQQRTPEGQGHEGVES